MATITRRRKLRICMLCDDNGIWINNPNDLKSIVVNYFRNLFSHEDVLTLEHYNNIAKVKISEEENHHLKQPVSDKEIWDTVKNIGAFKAPGPDGVQGIFYHKFWDIVGPSVCMFVKNCFANKEIPIEANETLITLIPKIDNSENIKQFRPVSLCNVSYKIITKIIVNRIRPLIDQIISPNQSSFISCRSTTDNIIITQEILHTLRHKKCKLGGMILKIDLEKAFDRISWDFIFNTLLNLILIKT